MTVRTGLGSILECSEAHGKSNMLFENYNVVLPYIFSISTSRCSPGCVVGIYDDGINVPSSHALFIAVCASEPDTLGELPEGTDSARFVAIAVVGEVPVVFSNPEEILGFGTDEVNRFVCVNVDGTIGFWDSTTIDPTHHTLYKNSILPLQYTTL